MGMLLEGRAFVAEVGKKGEPADVSDDILSFRDGMFHSSACDQWGYGSGTYSARAEGEAVLFEAQTRSERYGELQWRGRVSGSEIAGTLLRSRDGAQRAEMWFKGRARG
jgi:hypothetical protein